MEVWKSWTGTNTFTSGRTSVTLALPVSFIETPHMVASVIGDTSVYWSAVVDCRYISGNSIQVIAERVKDNISGSYKIGVSLYAYGKWK